MRRYPPLLMVAPERGTLGEEDRRAILGVLVDYLADGRYRAWRHEARRDRVPRAAGDERSGALLGSEYDVPWCLGSHMPALCC
ncbi:hypothetical protein Ttaiw_00812 [Tepidimonas taiwanensis]|uniref:Uncharacterized protein n=1 Tax=Tepidimonas taiwanensis TaxID=307486 RepID=A0A554XAT4_9BURK|nr:hypothetical protein Ttaiw_00812 [Tepidimonas taiwanensis]